MSLNEVSGSLAGIRFGRVGALFRLRPGAGVSLLGPGSAPGNADAPGAGEAVARDFFGFLEGACSAEAARTGSAATTVDGDGVVAGAAALERGLVFFRVGDCASLAAVSAEDAGASTGAAAAG